MNAQLGIVSKNILSLLDDLDTSEATCPPTTLYNEGWLLRLVLLAAERGIPCFPFSFEPGSRWFSEALLYSVFQARKRGDPFAESCTHADGVIGSFSFAANSKTGLTLLPDCRQFIVCEAKIYSGLSAGTTKAPGFDQAARNVACIAETLRLASREPKLLASVGFYVLAPASQIGLGRFSAEMSKDSIRSKVAARIRAYEPEYITTRLQPWFDRWFSPLLETMEVGCISWESILEVVGAQDAELGAGLNEFYARCLRYNGAPFNKLAAHT